MTHIAGLILQVVTCLAEYPADVKVSEVSYGKHRILIVRCCASDMGRLVGRHGRVAKAIRVIAFQIGIRLGVRYRVEFEEAKISAHQ